MDKLICPVVLNMDLTLPDHAEVNRDASVVDSAEDDHVTCVRTMVMYWLSERVRRVRSGHHFSIQSICVASCIEEQIASAH